MLIYFNKARNIKRLELKLLRYTEIIRQKNAKIEEFTSRWKQISLKHEKIEKKRECE